jgi:hypothetical protein
MGGAGIACENRFNHVVGLFSDNVTGNARNGTLYLILVIHISY